jgi:hypothetical protein
MLNTSVQAVSGPVSRYEFMAGEGADAHCQMGNAQSEKG